MAWTEECQAEIDRLIETKDISEVFAQAVNIIIRGKIDMAFLSIGHSCGCDPVQTVDFGERLLCACVDKIRGVS